MPTRRSACRATPAGLVLTATLGLAGTLGLAARPGPLRAQPRPFRPEDTYHVATLSAPAMSPDGRLVAVVVTRVVERQNARHAEVWLAPTRGGASTRLAFADTVEVNAPRWAPNGQLYVTAGPRRGRAQSYAVPIDPTGAPSRPSPAPSAPPAGASWSRDGRLAVWGDSARAGAPRATADTARGELPPSDTAARAPASPGAALARRPYGAVTGPLEAQRFDGRQFVAIPYKSNDLGFVASPSGPPAARPVQLYAWAPGDAERRALTATAYSHREAALSPDGRFVAFVADSALRSDAAVAAERDSLATLPYDRARDEADRDEVDVYVAPVDGGAAPRKLATLVGGESQLAWSPDGRTIAFVWRPGRTKSARLATVDVASGRVRDLLGGFAYEPEQFAWASDLLLVMNAQVGGRTAVFRVGSGGGGLREVVSGSRRLTGLTLDAGRRQMAYVSTEQTAPTELFVANADGTNEHRITGFNDALRREVGFARGERFTYASVGGREIEGWLMKPFGYDAARRYPLVLYIHGGPHSNYGEGWFDEFQNLAATGTMVLFTNPRGSTGYGAEFTYSTRGRWGAEDYEDLMRAVDLAARRADVDSTRMGVTGGSYGGFMTAWITTRTDRFKAAEADRMISDWTYWYGASDAQALTEFEFAGRPWENQAMYDSLSPVRRVARVRTPTLLVQSEEDFRTPMGNAELWFLSLRKRGVPAEFVRYPRSTHELSRSGEPWLLADRLGRLRQWFTYWLAAPGPARSVSAGEVR